MGTETPGNQSQSQPMPAIASAELAIAAINSLRAEFAIRLAAVDTRFEAMDRAVQLQHDDYVRVPTLLDRAVNDLKTLISERFDTTAAHLRAHVDVTAEKFVGIENHFRLRADLGTQRDESQKTAIATALSAQKETTITTTEMIVSAMAKMETNFTRQIEQGQTLVNEVKRNTDERINDIKSRMDRGEGRTSVTDPAVGAALAELSQGIKTLAKPLEAHASSTKDVWIIAAAAIGVISALIAISFAIFTNSGSINKIQGKTAAMYQTVQEEEINRPPPTPPIMKFLVQTAPGGRPTPFSEPSDTLEECLADTNAMLRIARDSAKAGRFQAGCVVTIEPDAPRS